MKALGQFTAFLFLIVCSFLSSLLVSYVVLSVANLYCVGFITQLSFLQLYGVVLIVSLLKYKYEKSKEEEESFSKFLKNAFTAQFTTIFIVFVTWGLAFLAHYIIS